MAADLTPVVSDPADVRAFAGAKIHIKVDTGMSRLGARPATLPALLEACREAGVEIAGYCTHLASADVLTDAGSETTRAQLERFAQLRQVVTSHGFTPAIVHAANSAGTLRFDEAHYDAVRPGLAIYGMGVAVAPDLGLRPAMRLATEIVQLRDLAAGDAVSYGGLWRAPGPARVATLPVGYADGYIRRPTGGLEVLIGGRRCSVLGAVCMDMTIVDVTELGQAAAVGDEAVLLGGQGAEEITTAELAKRSGLIEYEITCAVSKRVPRVYKGGHS
jgi:alanine racemase